MGWYGPNACNCGCIGECDCNECTPRHTICSCSDIDYGVEDTVRSLRVDVTGSVISALPSPNPSGTDIIPCGALITYQEWSISVDTGTTNPFISRPIYRIIRKRIIWQRGELDLISTTGIFRIFYFDYSNISQTTNPYPTWTDTTASGIVGDSGTSRRTFDHPTDYVNHYQCIHDSICKPACDPGTLIWKCPLGDFTEIETVTDAHCDLTSLNITLSLV